MQSSSFCYAIVFFLMTQTDSLLAKHYPRSLREQSKTLPFISVQLVLKISPLQKNFFIYYIKNNEVKMPFQNNRRLLVCIPFFLPWKILQVHVIAIVTDTLQRLPTLIWQQQPTIMPKLTTNPCISATLFKEI